MGLLAVMFNHSCQEIDGTRNSWILPGLDKPWTPEPSIQLRSQFPAGSKAPVAHQFGQHVPASLADPSDRYARLFRECQHRCPGHHRESATETVVHRRCTQLQTRKRYI